ncbi:pseudouridine synthase [Campylobacter estrildidarum]|uniref:Pseudouridine synthase n=1 Tax=Campylobacter estrildidarum TaxID=2510189 RepID=A0A4U7BT76_9BACT|nr:pseudouridine synthase [Campylobacter estrildidarum]
MSLFSSFTKLSPHPVKKLISPKAKIPFKIFFIFFFLEMF